MYFNRGRVKLIMECSYCHTVKFCEIIEKNELKM